MRSNRDKTETDRHWEARSRSEQDPRKVNIGDLAQRTIENDFILANISASDNVLEVGCGNGYLTREICQTARHVDAFDYSSGMIEAARTHHSAGNVRFFVHSILDASGIDQKYDAVICVRVLINLANVAEQCAALGNLARWTRSGGRLILVEGFRDGFDALNGLRDRSRLPPLAPAPINFYSQIADLMPSLTKDFEIERKWNSGMYDILTRVAYPLLVGAENATGPGDFHERTLPLARQIVSPDLAKYARLHGFVLRRR